MAKHLRPSKKEPMDTYAHLAIDMSGDKVLAPVPFFDNTTTDSTLALDQVLTTIEVAKILKVSAQTVRRLQEEQQIRFLKIRGQIRYFLRDVLIYLEKSAVEVVEE